MTLAVSDGDPACASHQSVTVCSEPGAAPIKHVIVLIGENRSFDHVFGTYVPKAGQTISNLLSKGIVNADGTPGPTSRSRPRRRPPRSRRTGSRPTHAPYTTLPAPNTNGAPKGRAPDRAAVPDRRAGRRRDRSSDRESFLPRPAPLAFRPGRRHARDQRRQPPERLLSSTGPNMPYDAYTGDFMHRFYQMWQQADCSTRQCHPLQPRGCTDGLLPVRRHPVLDRRQRRRQPLAFSNVQNGDVPYLTMLANNYTLCDNMHQSVMGGTAPTTRSPASATRTWTDGHGNPVCRPPARSQTRTPRRHHHGYMVDGAFSNCSDPDPAGRRAHLGLPRVAAQQAEPELRTEHLLLPEQYEPRLQPDGMLQTGTVVPPPHRAPSPTRSTSQSISWRFYGGG